MRDSQHRMRPDDQKPPDVQIALLADPPELLLAAAGTLSREQPDACREFPPGGEHARVGKGCDDCACCDRADAGYCLEPAAQIVVPVPGKDLALDLVRPRVRARSCAIRLISAVRASSGKCSAFTSSTYATNAATPARPCRMLIPNSARCARKALISIVHCRISSSRVR
jgi:hypothetical protein